MTLSELNQLRDIIKEINEDRELLWRLKEYATATTHTLNGIRSGSGTTDKIGDAVVRIAEAEERYQRHISELQEIEKRITEYINAIPDSHTRRIFNLRFVYGLSWRAVARRIGGRISAESVKKSVYRYLKYHP